MLIIPAIDIKNGKAVRLTQGDYSKEKVYEVDPVKKAEFFESNGAKMIHIVDLDGAKSGALVNFEIIRKILKKVKVPIQVGGGIRNVEDIKLYLSLGVNRVILGSLALKDIDLLKNIAGLYGEKIIVGLDAKNDLLKTDGWLKDNRVNVFEFSKELKDLGIKRVIYTDISRDGTLTEPDFEGIEKLLNVGLLVIASGGVSNLGQIKRLKELGVEGVIIGKALYEGKISLKEAFDVS